MIMQIVSVFDRALQAFGRPIFVHSTGQAMRSFQDEVNNKDSEIFKHPEDYSLYHLGTWDDSTSDFNIMDNPEVLTEAKNVKMGVRNVS